MNDKIQTQIVDVLVVGSGGAGLTSALSAKENGATVTVVSKTYPTHSQTSQAQGGINCAINTNDIKNHIDDTLKSAHGLGCEDTISLMCNEAPNTINWLDKIGVPFSRTNDGKIKQRPLGGASNARACYSSDYTGLKILHTLYDRCIKEDISFINEHMLLSLIIEDNTIKGVTVLDIQNTKVIQILAKSVILATGGYCAIYDKYTTNSYATTGDGIAIALKYGVEVSNLEFVQFHPTSMLGNSILISESARGEGGYLVDQNGNRFIDELKPRDVVARAIYQKIINKDTVYLDLRHLGLEKIMETMPQERDLALKFANIKLESELLPIIPSAHYSMGGITTNINCQTNIKNLYAVGECANANIHGANRLGGNSLLEIITFGKIAGKNASKINEEYKYKNLQDIKQNDIQKIDDILAKETKCNFYDIKTNLANMMFKDVGLFRNASRLKDALIQYENLINMYEDCGIQDKSRIYNKTLIEFIQLQNSLDISKEIITNALNRTKSCGAHFRSDDEA
jgi:succinate dehydrogenase / fumarate reductase flavoprotein subunit